MAGRDLSNAVYQIKHGKASWAKKYTPEQREMIGRLLSYGHSMQSIRALEKTYPGELPAQVVAGIQATRNGAGRCRFTTETDSEGHTWMQYDKKEEVAEIVAICAKPKRPLPAPPRDPTEDRPPQKRMKVKREPLEEDTFLIRVDDSDDELHGKVVDLLRGKGYTVAKRSK